jgi:hypothetical protein
VKHIKLIIFLILVFAGSPFAQVDIEINNNMLLETNGGLTVEVSGDVVENGSGYLQGTVTSGDRASFTQFAGLTLSSSLEGKVTRVTGTQYPGTGINFTRYYNIENQSTTTNLITDVTTITASGEAGSLIGPFFHYTKNGSNWKGYGFGSNGSPLVSNSVLFAQNSVTDLVISEGVGVEVKIFLEGPYNASIDEMNTTMNGNIPLLSPYSTDPRTATTKPNSAVDWVLIELRDQTTPSSVIASRSAYLNNDGNLIDDNATAGRGIGIAAPPGDYFIVIKHRNHLDVMTQGVQSGLTWGTASTVSTYDFTMGSGQFFGGSLGAIELNTSPVRWGMIAGNANGDSDITTSDYNLWLPENNSAAFGYKATDMNLDGNVTTSDYNLWLPNNNGARSSQVP